MQKLIYFTLIILGLLSHSTFAQNNSGVIMYGQNIEKFIVDTTKMNDSFLKQVLVDRYKEKQRALAADQNYYILKFSNKNSVFETINTMGSDGNGEIANSLSKGTYYVNLKDNSIYHKGNFMGKNLIIFYEKQPYEDWQIKNEKKIIRGYNCIKAETVRQNEKGIKTKVIAWFTTDINLSLGPKNYFGLPGLIIELHELDSVYYVREIKFDDVKLDKIDKKNSKIITYDQYKNSSDKRVRF